MGSRGKKRVRANGQVATGKLPTQKKFWGARVQFSENPIPPVTTDMLAVFLAISNKHLPIAGAIDDDDYDREVLASQAAWDELKSLINDNNLAYNVEARASMLLKILKDQPTYYSVDETGAVNVRADLLEFAASSDLTDHPDERLEWVAGG